MDLKKLGVLASFAISSYFSLAVCQESPDPSELREGYRSAYKVEFSFPKEELIGDLLSGERGNPKEESSLPCEKWNSKDVRDRYGSWGPPAKEYPQPAELEGKSVEWKRERAIATGLRFLNYPYQHHHIPDWNPPDDWLWKPVGEGRNTKGLDCSNFSSFVYNQAFGIKPNSDVRRQAEMLKMPLAGRPGLYHEALRIERPASYEAFKSELKTGDLLFIESKGEITHVVLWVGGIGRSPEGAPLVLDSTDGSHKDAKGRLIPNGVNLRPFTESSWYFKGASHAIRIFN